MLIDETIKNTISVTFVLAGILARSIGDRPATEWELTCGLSICRKAVSEMLRDPLQHESIMDRAMQSITLLTGDAPPEGLH